jgi:hypothetical protein
MDARRGSAVLRLVGAGAMVAVIGVACGGTATGTGGNGEAASPLASTELSTSATASAASDGDAMDACAALPRATIQDVLGADPGQGDLETTGGLVGVSSICRYHGEARVIVEIDEGSGVADARVSIEAYGETCEAIDDIGLEAVFCKGGSKAEGLTGQIVWTDGTRTYDVDYNFGTTAPSKDVVLSLARRLGS